MKLIPKREKFKAEFFEKFFQGMTLEKLAEWAYDELRPAKTDKSKDDDDPFLGMQ